MKHLLIPALVLLLSTGQVSAQCTISNATVYNLAVTGNSASFNLKFNHVRNAGNKWITIHLWNATGYPSYGYGSAPTTATLGGQVPFGTIVIDNAAVSATGTYTAAQAYGAAYQNDAGFVMATGIGSSLEYDAAQNLYKLIVLNVTVPGGLVNMKADAWSSQASNNKVVHCFYKEVPIVVVPLPATGLESSFKAQAEDDVVNFSWTSLTEQNVAYYVVEKNIPGTSDWIDAGMIDSKNPKGNSSTPTSYTLQIDTKPIQYGYLWLGLFLVMGLLISGKFRPLGIACVTLYAGMCITSCKKSTIADKLIDQKQKVSYRLKTVDIDGKAVSRTSYRTVTQ